MNQQALLGFIRQLDDKLVSQYRRKALVRKNTGI
jgi:hypothetical protein